MACKQLEMDATTLAGVVRDCFPRLRVRNVSRLQEGWANYVIEVNHEIMFRFPKESDAEDNLRKEVRLLPKMAGYLTTSVPRFDFIWKGGRRYERWFVGYRKIAGVPIGRWCVREPHSEKMAARLAHLLSEIHRFPYKRMKGLKLCSSDPVERERRMRSLYARMEKKGFSVLTTRERRKTTDFFEEQLADSKNFSFSPTFIHDDLSAPHVLCRKDSNRINGVIDWEDASIGDPAGDFYGIVESCGVSFVERVLEKYEGEPDPCMLQRARLYVRLVPFYEILYGQEHDRATLKFGLGRLRKTLFR